MTGTHLEREDHPWQIRIPDHPRRGDSPEFVHARATMHKILETLTEYPFGPGPWQAHHGGSLWSWDGEWFLLLNIVGIEWSMQFAADPVKVERVRRSAARHYARFPETVEQLDKLGYHQAEDILTTPITDADMVARYVDSIFNSCVPLAAGVHTGVVPAGAGAHHYPRPVADGQFIVHDDFQLFVTDPDTGHELAVVPVARRGEGDGRVQVVYAPPGSPHNAAQHAQEARGLPYVLAADHPLARAAFARQS